MSSGLVVDLFAGGGGASVGLEAALGRTVSVAVNHSAVALAVHATNHPRTVHLVEGVFKVDPAAVVGRRRVDVLWASPDCTHFSRAKGGKPRKQGIRSLAWAVVDWARLPVSQRPRVIFLENVDEFRTWGPLDSNGHPVAARMGETFDRWKATLELLGYVVDFRVLEASRYGAPTKRRRLFLVARCDGLPVVWPEPTHGPGLAPVHTAAECIDWTLPCPSIFDRKRPLAEKTLARVAAGVRRYVLETPMPYVVDMGGPAAPTLVQTSYGERKGQRPRYLDLHQPLGTVVAGGQKHALVAAFLAKHFGGVVGHEVTRPVGAVTAKDHHSLVTASLDGAPDRREQVWAFLSAYYGNGKDVGQSLREPMRTVVTRDRFALVTVGGVEHIITDIGMRMLEPHELLRAQFGRFAEGYDLSAARTKAAKVRLIGNSVCPEVAEAVVRANTQQVQRRAA